jgi:hypothetical protein
MAVMAVEAVPEAAESGAAGAGGAAGGARGAAPYRARHAAPGRHAAPARPRARGTGQSSRRGQGSLAPRKNPAQTGGQGSLAPNQGGRGRPGRQGQGPSQNPATLQQQAQGQAAKQGRRLTQGTYHRIVIAEFIATVLIIFAAPILVPRDSNSDTPEKEAAAAVRSISLSAPLIRLTAACLVFFVLALLANGRETGRISAALGLLVVLGALLNASDTLTALGQLFTGAQVRAAGADQGLGAAVDQAANFGKDTVTT